MTALLLALLNGMVVLGVRLTKMSRGCCLAVARDILGSLTPILVPGWHVLSKRDRVHSLTCLQPSSTVMAPTEAFHDLEFAMLERNEGKVVCSIEALQKDSIHSGE